MIQIARPIAELAAHNTAGAEIPPNTAARAACPAAHRRLLRHRPRPRPLLLARTGAAGLPLAMPPAIPTALMAHAARHMATVAVLRHTASLPTGARAAASPGAVRARPRHRPRPRPLLLARMVAAGLLSMVPPVTPTALMVHAARHMATVAVLRHTASFPTGARAAASP